MININDIIIGSKNISLGNVNVEPDGFDQIYMDKERIEDKFNHIINLFQWKKNYIYNFLLDILKPNMYIFLMKMTEPGRYCLFLII